MLEFGQASLHFRCFFPNHYDGTTDPVPPQVFSSLLMPWARGSKWFAAIGVFWPLGNRDVRVGATWLMDAYGACISLNICPHVSPTISVWHWTTLHARYADATSANICKPSQHTLAFVCVRGATHMCFKVSKKGPRVDKNDIPMVGFGPSTLKTVNFVRCATWLNTVFISSCANAQKSLASPARAGPSDDQTLTVWFNSTQLWQKIYVYIYIYIYAGMSVLRNTWTFRMKPIIVNLLNHSDLRWFHRVGIHVPSGMVAYGLFFCSVLFHEACCCLRARERHSIEAIWTFKMVRQRHMNP